MHFNLTLAWKYITHHIARILTGGNFDVLQLDSENLSSKFSAFTGAW